MAMVSAHGQDLNSTPGTAPVGPSAPGKTSALPPITVTAKVLRQRIDTYVSKVSGAYVWSDDHPMARWRTAICPLVAGLPHAEGQFLFDHLSDVLTSLNMRLGATGCRPNFFVVVTAQPEAVLRQWWHHDVNMFGEARGADKFIGTPRPVRVWYNSALVDEDGVGLTRFGVGGAFDGIPRLTVKPVAPRQNFWSVPDLMSVIAVVDLNSLSGLNWGQLTDYIAMTGVTRVNLDAHFGEAPTIMSLFSASGDAAPERLSDWDRSFIKQVYATDPVDRHQRVWIAKAMFADVAPDPEMRR